MNPITKNSNSTPYPYTSSGTTFCTNQTANVIIVLQRVHPTSHVLSFLHSSFWSNKLKLCIIVGQKPKSTLTVFLMSPDIFVFSVWVFTENIYRKSLKVQLIRETEGSHFSFSDLRIFLVRLLIRAWINASDYCTLSPDRVDSQRHFPIFSWLLNFFLFILFPFFSQFFHVKNRQVEHKKEHFCRKEHLRGGDVNKGSGNWNGLMGLKGQE